MSGPRPTQQPTFSPQPHIIRDLNYVQRPLCLSKFAPSVVLLCSGVAMVARLNWNESFSCAPALRVSKELTEFRSSAAPDYCIVGCRQRRRLRRGLLIYMTMTADDGGWVIVRYKIYCRKCRTGDVGCGADEGSSRTDTHSFQSKYWESM